MGMIWTKKKTEGLTVSWTLGRFGRSVEVIKSFPPSDQGQSNGERSFSETRHSGQISAAFVNLTEGA